MAKFVSILIVCGLIAVQDIHAKPATVVEVETALNPLEVAPVEENGNYFFESNLFRLPNSRGFVITIREYSVHRLPLQKIT